jgi:hypothetical protein
VRKGSFDQLSAFFQELLAVAALHPPSVSVYGLLLLGLPVPPPSEELEAYLPPPGEPEFLTLDFVSPDGEIVDTRVQFTAIGNYNNGTSQTLAAVTYRQERSR